MMEKQNGIQKESKMQHKTHSVSDEVLTELTHWLLLVAEERDKQAFAQLFSWFAPKIKQFGYRQFNNDALAQELIQETMTRVWRKAHLYQQGKGLPTTWVYTVMRNTCFDTHRKMNTQKEDNISDEIWPLVEAQQMTHDDDFADHLMTQQIENYLDALPEAQKQVVKGLYMQELSQEQLAKQLGIPLGTIKSRLRLALAKLKVQLEKDK